MNQQLVILGTHVFAEEVADLAVRRRATRSLPSRRTGIASAVAIRYLVWPGSGIDDLEPLAPTHAAICAIGSTRRSQFIEPVCDLDFRFSTLLDTRVLRVAHGGLGAGCVIGPGSVIAARACLGDHVIVNRGNADRPPHLNWRLRDAFARGQCGRVRGDR